MRRWGYGILGALIFAFLAPLGVMFGGLVGGVTLFAMATPGSTVEGIWVLIILVVAVLAIPAGLLFGWREGVKHAGRTTPSPRSRV